MDLDRIIDELLAERNRIDQVIRTLEVAETGAAGVRRRGQGRQSMDPEARKEVSERMKRYWAARRGDPEVRPDLVPGTGCETEARPLPPQTPD